MVTPAALELLEILVAAADEEGVIAAADAPVEETEGVARPAAAHEEGAVAADPEIEGVITPFAAADEEGVIAPDQEVEGVITRPAAAEEEGIIPPVPEIEGFITPSAAADDSGEADGEVAPAQGDNGQASRELPPAVTDDGEPQRVGNPAPADEAGTKGELAPRLTASSGGTAGSRVIRITADGTSVGAQRSIQELTRRFTLRTHWGEPGDDSDVLGSMPPNMVAAAPPLHLQLPGKRSADKRQGHGIGKGLFKRLVGLVKSAVKKVPFRMTVEGCTVVNTKSHLEPSENRAACGLSVALLPQERHMVCRQAQGVFLGQTTEWML